MPAEVTSRVGRSMVCPSIRRPQLTSLQSTSVYYTKVLILLSSVASICLGQTLARSFILSPRLPRLLDRLVDLLTRWYSIGKPPSSDAGLLGVTGVVRKER
jgi:hypothetical protein